MNYLIKPVSLEDNLELMNLANSVLKEVKCVGPGLTSEDASLKNIYAAYQKVGSKYWVIQDRESKKIMGAGGFSKLAGTSNQECICELQKVYFYSELRGQGFGRSFVEFLIQQAKDLGYKMMYLETLPSMRKALILYQNLGFRLLPEPLGNTGHYSDFILYMLLDLDTVKLKNIIAHAG